jgi:hypothetical protein
MHVLYYLSSLKKSSLLYLLIPVIYTGLFPVIPYLIPNGYC